MPRTEERERRAHEPNGNVFRAGKPKAFVNWLRRTHGAVKLRCETEEGDKLVTISEKGGTKQQAITARAVMALGAFKCEALDKSGDTLDVFLWVDPNADDPNDPTLTAYAKDPDDGVEERVLKVFGQLLAAAHHSAAKQLVETVQLMSTHYSQERQAMRGQAEALERLNARLARRVRVADVTSEEGEPEENFLEGFIQQMVAQKMAQATAPTSSKTNGKEETDA